MAPTISSVRVLRAGPGMDSTISWTYLDSAAKRAPGATASRMIGLIVACCTLGGICYTKCPPCWIRPRIGGLFFPACRARASASACGAVPTDAFCPRQVGLCAGQNVDFAGLNFACQLHGPNPRHHVVMQMLGHGLHFRAIEVEPQRSAGWRGSAPSGRGTAPRSAAAGDAPAPCR